MFAGLVVTDYPMRCLPSARPHVGGAEVVSVLARSFPVEVNGLTLEYLAISARHFNNFAGPSPRGALVPDTAEMHPTATRGVWGLDDSPPVLGIPIPHRTHRAHIRNTIGEAMPWSISFLGLGVHIDHDGSGAPRLAGESARLVLSCQLRADATSLSVSREWGVLSFCLASCHLALPLRTLPCCPLWP